LVEISMKVERLEAVEKPKKIERSETVESW
jgi:hypothetical protein